MRTCRAPLATLAQPCRRGCLLLVLLFVVAACGPADEVPPVVRVGVLPDQAADRLEARYAPLLSHLSGVSGAKIELVVPDDYEGLLRMFVEGRLDLAYLGGLTFLKARQAGGAIPIAMRDVDARFTSYFMVRANDRVASLAELKGRRLAFGSRLSTSGHLMPRHHMVEIGIDPEAHFSEIKFSGAHDTTALWVRDGVVDVGAVNGLMVDSMFADGRLSVWPQKS